MPTTPPPPAQQQPKDPTTAIGLNKATDKFLKQVKEIDKKCTNILIGKAGQDKGKFTNPIDYGIKPSVDLLASIDLCSILNFLLDQIPAAKKFDPNDQSERQSALGRIKYDIQYSAFTIQSYIDDYYSTTTDLNNPKDPENVTKLQRLLNKIGQTLSVISGPESQDLFNNADINNAFPQMATYGNFIDNARETFNRYTDLKNIPVKEFQKIVGYIDKTKQTCILIQGLNTPANLISFVDSFAKGQLSEQIQKLNKIIDPKKIANFVKNIKTLVQKLKNVVDFVFKIINFVRFILNIAVIIIKIVVIVAKFLVALPIPNIFTLVGNTTTVADAKKKIDDKAKYFIDRISEANRILQAIYTFCVRRSSQLGQIINSLQIVIINLQNCDDANENKTNEVNPNNINSVIFNDLQQSIDTLNVIKTELDNYVKNYDNNKEKRKRKYGNYTIEIITEEVVDEGINLRRRYGVALDQTGVVFVQSTPTFASEDSIIIQEVKLLISSKTEVKKVGTSSVSSENQTIIEEALNYSETEDPEDLSLDTIDEINFDPELDDPENEDDDNGLGLNSFINKMKGGRRLRKKMRQILAKKKIDLAGNLQKADPKGNVAGKLTNKAKKSALQDQILAGEENVKILKEDIAITIAAIATTPLPPTKILLIKKLAKQREDLKNQQSTLVTLKKELASIK